MCIGRHVKPLLVLSVFESMLNFIGRSSKNNQVPNFMKIREVEAELFHSDERTDGLTDRRDEANSSCSLFCERP